MITIGSISRELAAQTFEFLAPNFRGRRQAMRAFTHAAPELVFWVAPDGELWDARDAHRNNPPENYEWILDDEPDYGGFLRGRVARRFDQQLIVIYCRPELLAQDAKAIAQLLDGLSQMPIPIDEDALIVSDNADIYGTVSDLRTRLVDGVFGRIDS